MADTFEIESKPAYTRAKLEENSSVVDDLSEENEEDDSGLLPIMLEDALERAGVMNKLQPVLSPVGQIKNVTVRQLLAELLGTMLFQIFGGAAPGPSAGPANGFALAALIYAFANTSGGQLNPAVSFALICTGHMKWWKGMLYACAQILGAIFGAMIYAGLIPGLEIGQSSFQQATAPGCFGPAPNVSTGELFCWEMIMTFLLVMTVYASAVAKPGHGNAAPLAIGLSLYAAALTGGPYTGASLNPARTLGPAITFACNLGVSFTYVAAELFGALLAAGASIFLYGRAEIKRSSRSGRS